MPAVCTRLQTNTSRTEGRLVCGDCGDAPLEAEKEGTLRIRGRSAQEAARARTCEDEADVRLTRRQRTSTPDVTKRNGSICQTGSRNTEGTHRRCEKTTTHEH